MNLSYALVLASIFSLQNVRADDTLDKVTDRANEAARILRYQTDKKIPHYMIAKADCIAVVPNFIRGGFGFGAKGGKGLVSCRQDGEWSFPSYISIGGISWGLQAGIEKSDMVLVFVGKDSIKQLMKRNFNGSVDIAATAGPYGRSASAGVDIQLKNGIYSYGTSKWLYGGITANFGGFSPDLKANRAVYGSFKNHPSYLLTTQASDVPKAVEKFMKVLNDATEAARTTDETESNDESSDETPANTERPTTTVTEERPTVTEERPTVTEQTRVEEQTTVVEETPTPTPTEQSSTTESCSDLPVSSIDTSSRKHVSCAYKNWFKKPEPTMGWTGSVNGCEAGTTSEEFQQRVVDQANYFRAMVGLQPAKLVPNSVLTQNAALIMKANGSLSHTPTSEWKCYSEEGRKGAGTSNLALGSSGIDAIKLYMDDPGSNNEAVGHRRWIIYPPLSAMSTGDTPGSNSLGVFLESNNKNTDNYITWPSKGFFPYELLPSSKRWSVSKKNASFDSAVVEMKNVKTGETYPVTLEPLHVGYGYNTLVFMPSGLKTSRPSSDTEIEVKISGIKINGQETSLTYTVTIINP